MKKPIALLLGLLSASGCSSPGSGDGPVPIPNGNCVAIQPEPLPPGSSAPGASSQIIYRATFPCGSLENGIVDAIHSPPWPMKKGEGGVVGQTDSVSPAGITGVRLSVAAPNPIPKDASGNNQTSSVGVFNTALNFGPGSVFTVRATFQKPNGPRIPANSDDTNAWSIGVSVRTGDERDLASDKRLGVTFRVKNQDAILNIQETDPGSTDGTVVNSLKQASVPRDMVDKIFGTSGAPPQPFTLELFVDRDTGTGVATLIPSNPPVKAGPFVMLTFQAKSGPVLKTAGATLANCCAPGATVSVDVTEFEIVQVFRGQVYRGGWGRIEPPIPQPPPINPH